MASGTPPQQPELERVSTSPPTSRTVTEQPVANVSDAEHVSETTQSKINLNPFEDDLQSHPEDHFLSPVYGYEDWSEEDDDDGEDEWDAGITDFALFDDDRRRAQEENGQLPGRWADFMSQQQSALQRSLERTNALPVTTRPPLPAGEVPALTPDGSPNLRDNLEGDPFHRQSAFQAIVPSYLTLTVMPPSESQRTIADEEDLPLFSDLRTTVHKQRRRNLPRPGLQYNRTMSGKAHVWRRPGWDLYSVGEDSEAEKSAELSIARSADGMKESEEGEGERGRH
ncbi:hypothetical protein LTR08_002366 [Meristemomyces frigidus]|nr:hypothetical protein LTR08_002366 [Meristemomyces frigidus]